MQRLLLIRERKLFSGDPLSWPMYGHLGPNRSVSYFISVQSMHSISRLRSFPICLASSVLPCPEGPVSLCYPVELVKIASRFADDTRVQNTYL
jgi:hypothetical protein